MELSSGGWPVWSGQFTPFGQEIVAGQVLGWSLGNQQPADGTNMHYKFTGKERDSESGLDYFGARYYASNVGRWISADWAQKPEAVPYSKLDDPQTLNLYTYVSNNPLSRVDPDGHLEAQWHALITYLAARNTGHGRIASANLAAKTAWVDFRHGSQHTDAVHSNWHGMRGVKPDGTLQSTAESHEGTRNTVDNAMKSGDTALALHAVEDSATPMHDGHAWTGIFSESFPKHFFEDNLPTPTTIMNSYTNAVVVLDGENPLRPIYEPAPPPPPKQQSEPKLIPRK
ncbi:MAG TPA: RHS repeat-associated core domain-containing protein [Bryocella sp.]|nr:RHS repeat-associated core domain-containing protein [Bryocella sp.]